MDRNSVRFKIKRHREASTVIVPDKLISYLNKRIKKHKGKMDQYFIRLMKNAKQVGIQQLPGAKKLKTRYQKQGQKPVRVGFRIDNFTWHDAKQIARTRGYSICLLFVILMQKEKKNKQDLKSKVLKNRKSTVLLELFDSIEHIIQRQIIYEDLLVPD